MTETESGATRQSVEMAEQDEENVVVRMLVSFNMWSDPFPPLFAVVDPIPNDPIQSTIDLVRKITHTNSEEHNEY